MKLFWAPQTRAQRAIWMLEEAGVDYEMERVGISDEDRQDSAEFLAASPMGKVPALVDGDVKMSDSAAICLYLADRYAPGKLAPALDAPERGAFLYWMLFTPGVLEPAMAEKVGGHDVNPRTHGWGDFPSMIETLEGGLTPGPGRLSRPPSRRRSRRSCERPSGCPPGCGSGPTPRWTP